MPIVTTDIKFYLTGGSTNSSTELSLGGVLSGTEVQSGALHNLFDKVTGDESLAGDIEYRCVGVRNTHASLTWEAVRAYIAANTPAGDDISIAVETPVGGAVGTIANDSVAPAGRTFVTVSDRATGLVCTGEGDLTGNVGPGRWFAIWIKRNVPAGTAAFNNNTATIKVDGDTAA